MSAINAENRAAWQALADEAEKNRPRPGRTVRVIAGGRRGLTGIVRRHQRSNFTDAYRYASEAQAHLRDIQGRYGYCVLIEPVDGGKNIWTNADNVEVLS